MLCLPCHDKLKGIGKCDVCGVAVAGGYRRCHGMERLVDSLRAACPNAPYGCAATPPYHSREEHLLACPHAPRHCPVAACGFAGSTAALGDHIASAHRHSSPCEGHEYIVKWDKSMSTKVIKVAKYNNEDVIVLNLDPKSPRLIKPEVLRIIHGNPRGTAEVPKDILECPDVEPVDLRNFILDANPENSGKFFITISQIKEACSAARRDGDIRMEVRLFLSALFNFSSFTTSALYLTQKNEEYVLDMKKIATND
nr:unnamed protein product [Digitaria exilis]